MPVTVDQPRLARRWPIRRPGRRARWVLIAASALVLVIVAAGSSDYAVLAGRIRHVHVSFPPGGDGQTWVVVGSDSRADPPSGPAAYGTAAEVPGQRADIVLVIHRYAGRTAVLSVPRDLLVVPGAGQLSRLALTLDPNPQALIDGLCSSLRIPADHLVIVTMKAFAGVVDAVGGVTVSIPHPIRDPSSGLSIPAAGDVHLGGTQALALVRSRQPQQLIGATWTPVSEATGAADRTRSAGSVFTALRARAQAARTRPVTAQRVLWRLTGGITTDSGTGLRTLLDLDLGGAGVTDLPAAAVGDALALSADSGTDQALDAAGYTRTCR